MTRSSSMVPAWLGLCAACLASPSARSAPDHPSSGVEMPPRLVKGQGRFQKRVVLVGMETRFSAESWPEAERRATAELRALGFQVVRVEAHAQETDARIAELGARAAAEQALASVRIVRHGDQQVAQLWLHDALTGKMLLRRIEMGRPGSADAGMRVVELIYASLLETQLREQSRTPPAIHRLVRERLAQVRRPPSKPKRGGRWAVSLSAALQFEPGETEPAFGLDIGLQRWLTPQFAIGAELTAPLGAATVTAPEGEADLQLTSVRLAASYSPWPNARVSPSLALGAGAMVLRSSGRAIPPHLSEVDWAAAFAMTFDLRLSVRIVRGLWLRCSGGPTVTLPSLGVRLGGNRVAVLGRPLLQFSLGVQWRWRS